MTFDVLALERAIEKTKTSLGGGVLATSIWERRSETSLVSYQSNPVAITMFNALTDSISAALSNSEFPRLHRFYLLDLEHNHMVLVIRHDPDILQGILLDTTRINIGLLFAVVIPNLMTEVNAARVR